MSLPVMWNLSFTFGDKYRASFFCVGIKTLLQVKQITELVSDFRGRSQVWMGTPVEILLNLERFVK